MDCAPSFCVVIAVKIVWRTPCAKRVDEELLRDLLVFALEPQTFSVVQQTDVSTVVCFSAPKATELSKHQVIDTLRKEHVHQGLVRYQRQ